MTMNHWSPVHWSRENRVHADRFIDGIPGRLHLPFCGQTTIDTFVRPSYANDRSLADLGGNPPSIFDKGGNFIR
jgi:hypothetical protein